MMQLWEKAFKAGIYGFFSVSGFLLAMFCAFGVVGCLVTLYDAIKDRIEKRKKVKE